MCVQTCAIAIVWRSEEHLQGSFLSFYHVDTRDPTSVIRFDSKHLYPSRHLTGPQRHIFYDIFNNSFAQVEFIQGLA